MLTFADSLKGFTTESQVSASKSYETETLTVIPVVPICRLQLSRENLVSLIRSFSHLAFRRSFLANADFSISLFFLQTLVLMSMKDIAVSSGSACTSASLEPSYVLRALGAEEDMAHSSIRFGIGRFTTEEEVDFVVDKVVSSVTRLRDLSPLWEMIQEGIDLKTIDW